MGKLWKHTAIARNTKLKFGKIYESKTKTIKTTEEKQVNVFKIEIYRKVLRIPWIAHKNNASVLDELKVKTSFIQGEIPCKHPGGRCPMRWSELVNGLTTEHLI